MPSRSWVFAIAIGLAITAGAITLIGVDIHSYQVEHAEQRKNAASYHAESKDQYAKLCVKEATGIVATFKCLVDSINSNKAAKRADYDLKAQQDMAEWAYILMWMSAGGLIVSMTGLMAIIYSLYQTKQAIIAAQDTVQVTREIGIAQTTAILDIVRIDVQGGYDENSSLISDLGILNIGNSGARRVAISVHLKIADKSGAALFSSELTRTEDRPINISAKGNSISRFVPVIPPSDGDISNIRDNAATAYLDVVICFVDVFENRVTAKAQFDARFELEEELKAFHFHMQGEPLIVVSREPARNKAA